MANLRIRWNYLKNKKNVRIGTRCILQNDFEEVVGVSLCHKNDTFDKEIGRKLSLKRALEEAVTVSKAERTQIWENYRHSTKDPRW